MQARDNALRVRWTGRRLRTERGAREPAPTWIPEANEAARLAAEAMGGLPGSGLNEVLLNRPFTAHILGGAPIGATPTDGVLDGWQRVWSEPGLHVVDGAAVSANLGTNPSLTIAAQAERAFAFWPKRGEADPRPAARLALRAVEPRWLGRCAAQRPLAEHPGAFACRPCARARTGIPARCTTTCVLTARCRWGSRRLRNGLSSSRHSNVVRRRPDGNVCMGDVRRRSGYYARTGGADEEARRRDRRRLQVPVREVERGGEVRRRARRAPRAARAPSATRRA